MKLGNHEFTSRFILGSGKYSLELIKAAVEEAGAQIVTMALRRANEGGLANILDYIPEGVTLLPNTSGARNADEAVRIARLAREVCGSDFIKIEIMRDTKYLLPDITRQSRQQKSSPKRASSSCFYVPGLKYGQGYGCGRRRLLHAAGRADRFQQRTLHQRIYSDPH